MGSLSVKKFALYLLSVTWSLDINSTTAHVLIQSISVDRGDQQLQLAILGWLVEGLELLLSLFKVRTCYSSVRAVCYNERVFFRRRTEDYV